MHSHAIRVLETLGAEQLDVVRSLRYEVLRRPLGMSYEETRFDGDALPTTRHLVALDGQTPLGCLTLLVPVESAAAPDPAAPEVQLRGMAVTVEVQGHGIGSQLLAHVHRLAADRGWHLWCKAREAAVPFYSKNGWRVRGDAFDIPGIGTHFTMHWEPGF